MKSEMTTAYAFLPRILNPGEHYDSMDLIVIFKSIGDALSASPADDNRFLSEIRCDDKGPDLYDEHRIYSFTMVKYLSFDDLLTPYPAFDITNKTMRENLRKLFPIETKDFLKSHYQNPLYIMTTAPLEENVRHELTMPAFHTAYMMFRAMPSKEPKEYHLYTIYNATIKNHNGGIDGTSTVTSFQINGKAPSPFDILQDVLTDEDRIPVWVQKTHAMMNDNEIYYIEAEDVGDDVKIHIIERFDVYSDKNPRRTNASIIDYALSSNNPDIRMALLWNRSLCNNYSKRNVILSILSHDMNADIRKLALEKLQTMKG